jgi:hypothetical protein
MGLVDIGAAEYHTLGKGRYSNFSIAVTHRVGELQRALGISLSEIAKLNRRSVVAAPLFGRPNTKTGTVDRAPDVFVLMPFKSELRPVYDDHIRVTVESLHLTVARADDFFTTHAIMSDIWNSIWSARALIADCTGRNPNVFYELGMAHTVGRPVVIISQSENDVPFDIRHLRYLPYEYTPRGMKLFEANLAETLRVTLGLAEDA